MKKQRYRRVYFKWADTTSPLEKSWWTEEEAKRWAKEDNYFVEQVGFLIERNKHYTLLASHINITISEGQESVSFGSLIKIPNTWIRDFKFTN